MGRGVVNGGVVVHMLAVANRVQPVQGALAARAGEAGADVVASDPCAEAEGKGPDVAVALLQALQQARVIRVPGTPPGRGSAPRGRSRLPSTR